MTQKPARLGLRARLTTAFALGALALSALVAIGSFTASRNYLISQREASATNRTLAQGQTLSDGLRSSGVEPGELLAGLRTTPDARLLLHLDERWYGVDVGEAVLVPDKLRSEVEAGRPQRQRITSSGTPQLIVGVPLIDGRAQLYEVFSLQDLDRTLRETSRLLLLIAVLTSVVGAGLGWWTSRRLLRPLDDVIATSRSIAGGRLSARLPATRDPDVAPFVESFNAMTQALQERIDRDARFAADVSHELRSPLTTLSTSLSVLQRRREEMGDRARRALDLLTEELQRFEQLVQDLLEISRLDSKQEFEREPVQLSKLVLHSPSVARLPNTPVVIDAGAAAAEVRGDKRRLERVLANLVENAVHYAGGVESIRVAEATDGVIRLVVDDTGPGVPPQDRQRIFDRFSRGSGGARDVGRGVGLGLALVSEQVAAHDGRVWVEDRPGGGARFIVELPRSET